MANRHLSRSVVMQTLFEWDFNDGNRDLDEVLKRNFNEFSSEGGDFSFMQSILHGVLEKKEDLDKIIETAAPQWPLEKISIVDRNVLRIGLYELLFSNREEVPAKVAINEAIEIAKKFGGEKSGKFVNGVLGAVYKEMGKPGVEESGKKKPPTGLKFNNRGGWNSSEEEIPKDKMCVENLAGAVIYSRGSDNKMRLALVHDVFGYWTLSKGRLKEGEDSEEGIKRIVEEEIGLSIYPEYKLGNNEYVSKHPEKKRILKKVTYFLASSPFEDIELKESGGLDDSRWFVLSDVMALNIYTDIMPIITQGINYLTGKNEEKRSKRFK